MTPFAVAAAVCAVAVLLLVGAERAGWRPGIWLTKPVASTAFVAAALAAGAPDTRYGQLVLLALGLSWLGDVLLIARVQAAFLAGLGVFLLGHVAYAAAFVARGVVPSWALATLAVLAPVAAGVGRWLLPHVPREMKVPVIAYTAVITSMVALAVGNYGLEGRALVPLSALCFYLSDLSVARDQFVAPGFDNRAWGLPLYYLAQLLFTLTI